MDIKTFRRRGVNRMKELLRSFFIKKDFIRNERSDRVERAIKHLPETEKRKIRETIDTKGDVEIRATIK